VKNRLAMAVSDILTSSNTDDTSEIRPSGAVTAILGFSRSWAGTSVVAVARPEELASMLSSRDEAEVSPASTLVLG